MISAVRSLPLKRLGIALILSLHVGNLSPASGSEVLLEGVAEDRAGDSLVFLTYTNMISFATGEIGGSTVSDSGFFTCRINIEETRLILLNLGVHQCYMYVEPGKQYGFKLPPRRDKTMAEMANPYFEPISVHMAVNDGGRQEDELNFLIRAFNDSFYPYYYKFVVDAYGNQSNQRGIHEARRELGDSFDSIDHPFLQDYIRYRMGLLEHYGGQKSSRKIIDEYFLTDPVLHQNPAYMELFNEVFEDFFLAFHEEHPRQQLPGVLNQQLDYHRAQEILIHSAGLEQDSLRELVFLRGLYDGAYDGENLQPAMLQLMDSLKENTKISVHARMAEDFIREISRVLPGYPAADFRLYNADSNLVSLKDYRGSYVYLNFCNSFAHYCIREYEYLKVLKQRLGDRLRVISILVDDSFESMKDLVSEQDYPWTMLHFSNQPGIIHDYEIQAYPSYFLIGPEGRLLLSPAPSPAQNFESTFLDIYESP